MDVLKKYEKRIADLLADNESKIQKCQDRVEALRGEILQAGQDMEAATDNIDVAGFKAAKRRQEDAAAELGMMKKKLAQLEKDPLISEAEYRSLRADIIAEHNRDFEVCKKKFVPIVREIIAAGERAGEQDERIDKMLEELQRKIMRKSTDPRQYGPNSPRYSVITDRLDEHSVVWFAGNVRDAAEGNGLM